MAVRSKYPPALILRTLIAWLLTLLLFFPLGWLILTAFKTELQAKATDLGIPFNGRTTDKKLSGLIATALAQGA